MDKRSFFDIQAKEWDMDISDEKIKKIKMIIKKSSIKKGDKILDGGCGTGILLPFLKSIVGTRGKIVALDFSEKMLKEAQNKFDGKFKYICAGIDSMPLKSSYFDKVICFSAFPHFPDKLKALHEISRVLKPAGRVIIAHASSRKTINLLHKQVGSAIKHDKIPPNKIMKDLLNRTGFKNIRIISNKSIYFVSASKNIYKL